MPRQQDDGFETKVRQVEEFLGRPEIQAGLLQFATSVLQPPGFGQSVLGQIGQSVAGGVEAAGRVVTQRQEQEQQQFEKEITGRETVVAERRAGATEEQNRVAAERNALLKNEIEQRGRQFELELPVKIRGQNADLLAAMARTNAATAQALLEKADLAPTQEERAALINRAVTISNLDDFELLTNRLSLGAGVAPGALTQSTVNRLIISAAALEQTRTGSLAQAERALLEAGATPEQIARAKELPEAQPAAPVPQRRPEVTGDELGAVSKLPPPPEARRPVRPIPGVSPSLKVLEIPADIPIQQQLEQVASLSPASSFTAINRAATAINVLQRLQPNAVSEVEFNIINNSPVLRAAARHVWGREVFDQVAASFTLKSLPGLGRARGATRKPVGVFRPGQ